MTTAADLIELMRTVDVETDAMTVIDANKDTITAYNREQMMTGKSPSGERIGVYRSRWYAQMKQSMNPMAGGGVDLRLTGAFQGAMFTKVSGQEWETSSTDGKLGELTEKYDDNFGLSSDNQELFNDLFFLPDFLKLLEAKTGLKSS